MKEKNKKIKLSLSRILVALLLISSWTVMGVVLALNTVNVQMGGMISFTTDNVESVYISGTITGTKTAHTLEDINIKSDTTQSELQTMQSSWQNWELDFSRSTNEVVIKWDVSNDSDETVWVTIKDNIGSDSNLYISRNYYDDSYPNYHPDLDSFTGEWPIWAGGIHGFTTTISIENLNKKIDDLTFALDVELSLFAPDRIKDVSEYSTLNFTKNKGGEFTVSPNPQNMPSGDLVIPDYVYDDGVLFMVDEMYDFSSTTLLTSVKIPSTVLTIYGDNFLDSGITSVIFDAPYGWKCIADSEENREVGLNVSDPTTAAENLKENYWEPIWYRDDVNPYMLFDFRGGDHGDEAVVIGVTEYNRLRGELVLPSQVYSYATGVYHTLSAIGENAFANCTRLTSVTIPDSITTIGTNAFSGCTQIKSVTFKNTTGWTAGGTEIPSTWLASTNSAMHYLVSTYVGVTWTKTN